MFFSAIGAVGIEGKGKKIGARLTGDEKSGGVNGGECRDAKTRPPSPLALTAAFPLAKKAGPFRKKRKIVDKDVVPCFPGGA